MVLCSFVVDHIIWFSFHFKKCLLYLATLHKEAVHSKSLLISTLPFFSSDTCVGWVVWMNLYKTQFINFHPKEKKKTFSSTFHPSEAVTWIAQNVSFCGQLYLLITINEDVCAGLQNAPEIFCMILRQSGPGRMNGFIWYEATPGVLHKDFPLPTRVCT